MSTISTIATATTSTYQFGQVFIRASEVFYSTALSFAFVNLKPITPGHVLVVPKRVVERLEGLTNEEVADLFLATQKVGAVIERHYKGTSLTIALQDGPDAGQSINHVHIHVMPRRKGDYPNNDDIYEDLNKNKLDFNERPARAFDDMASEAFLLRKLFLNQTDKCEEK